MTGFGTAARYGYPDVGLITQTEMAQNLKHVCRATDLPVVADADTGYGGPVNVRETVRGYEIAGVSAIQIEDQDFPKKCGHLSGHKLIPAEDMVTKIKVALDSRFSDDTLIIARTDARETDGLDCAIDRINRYCAAGADIAFIEAPLLLGELEDICRRVPYPKFVNMLAFGKTPILSAGELEEMGFKMMVAPIDSVLLTARAMRDLAETFKRDGHTRALYDQMVDFGGIKDILGLNDYLSLRERLQR